MNARHLFNLAFDQIIRDFNHEIVFLLGDAPRFGKRFGVVEQQMMRTKRREARIRQRQVGQRAGRNQCRNARRKLAEQIVALNDLGDANTNAHLTRYDSVHGRFPGEVRVDGDSMIVNGERIRVLAERDPAKLPGVRVSLVTSRDGVVVAIAQDLMGPIGRTEKYDALVTAVVTRLTACVGSENVRVE